MTQQKADPLRRKALACLREGRVTVLRASARDAVDPSAAPTWVLARVVSSRDGHPYQVQYLNEVWRCDCREGRRDLPCAHTLAVALVTTGVAS